jgi:hypothetical protein
VQVSAEGCHGRGVAWQKSGLRNTGDAGPVSVVNADGWKAIKLRAPPNCEQDEEREQGARLYEAYGPRKRYGSNRNHVC